MIFKRWHASTSKKINHNFTARRNDKETVVHQTKNTASEINQKDWQNTSFKQMETSKTLVILNNMINETSREYFILHIAIGTIWLFYNFPTAKHHISFFKTDPPTKNFKMTFCVAIYVILEIQFWRYFLESLSKSSSQNALIKTLVHDLVRHPAT